MNELIKFFLLTRVELFGVESSGAQFTLRNRPIALREMTVNKCVYEATLGSNSTGKGDCLGSPSVVLGQTIPIGICKGLRLAPIGIILTY